LAGIAMQAPAWIQGATLGTGSAFMTGFVGLGTIWAFRHRNDWRTESPDDE
jgi:hypothetical protein